MQRERERKPVEVAPFKPRSYKGLVEWFVVQVNSGTATKRDFVRLAEGLKGKTDRIEKDLSRLKTTPLKKPAGKAIPVDDSKAIGENPVKKKAEKK